MFRKSTTNMNQTSKSYRFVTSSWDDGHPLDVEIARLLEKYRVKGTFYVKPPLHDKSSLGDSDIRVISRTFEIGAHTITHPDLRRVVRTRAIEEITESKRILEDITHKKVEMFCYPMGLYDERVVRLVKDAGYIGARTMACFSISHSQDPFRLRTTVVAGPSSTYMRFFHIFRYPNPRGLYHLLRSGISSDWLSLAKSFFSRMCTYGGVFHFWGHSLAIEELGLWEELNELLRHVSGKEDVKYLTNGELVKVLTGDLPARHPRR